MWYVAWDCGISTTWNVPENCIYEKVEKQIAQAESFFLRFKNCYIFQYCFIDKLIFSNSILES